jgi:DNA topoisomerase-1
VIDTLDALLGPHFFPDPGNGTEPRACPACKSGRLGLRLGKTGGFLGCSNYPDCRYTRALGVDGDGGASEGETGDGNQPRDLGVDPATGLTVALRKGPFGFYVQLGEAAAGDKAAKPKRASLPRGMTPATVTLESALALLALPRELGLHPETQMPISAGLGRFGPYLKLGPTFKSLPKDEDVLTIGLNRAVVLLAEEKKRPGLLKVIGAHPDDAKEVTLHEGRYGNYVQHGAVRATLPTGTDGDAMSLEAAIALLTERGKASAGKPGARGKPAAKAAPAKKPAAKKAAAAKPAKAAAKPKTAAKAASARAARRTDSA